MRCSESEKALFDALRLIFSREYKFCDISASRSLLPNEFTHGYAEYLLSVFRFSVDILP